jgi:hypothetical protein
MRSYFIDELTPQDVAAIKSWLQERGLQSAIEDLFHLPLPHELLTPIQREHTACGPHVLALETGPTWIRLELLVRATGVLRCSCMSYATWQQEQAMVERLLNLLHELGIPT